METPNNPPPETPNPNHNIEPKPYVKYNWNHTQHTYAYETLQQEGAYTSFPDPGTWYLAEDCLPGGVLERGQGDGGGKRGGGSGDAEGEGEVVKGEEEWGEGGSEGRESEGKGEEVGKEWSPIRGSRDPRFIEKA